MTSISFGSDAPVLNLLEGCEVLYQGKKWVILRFESLYQVAIRCLEGEIRQKKTVDIKDLYPVSQETEATVTALSDLDLDGVSEEDWEIAERRLKIVRLLLSRQPNQTALVREAAKNEGIALSTVYIWRDKYLVTEKLSSLLPVKRPGGKGKGRLSEEVERIITAAIVGIAERPSEIGIAQVIEDIEATCYEKGLRPPAPATVRLRIDWRGQRQFIEKRRGKRAAAARFNKLNENTIRADYPLAVVQIDHCVIDVIVVHDDTRQPICRPWLTIAIDVNSRVIVGIYLSLAHPSATSVGACLAHAILPKEDYLRKLGVPVKWPVWGEMTTLHMDNGADFRSERLKPALKEYHIERQYRPVKKPEYGAHIERLIGTFAKRFRILPGATTNKPVKNEEYSPEKSSAFTMHELEKWLVEEINKYHHREHSGIDNETPLQRFERGLLQPPTGIPVGLPSRRTDVDRVKIDFLPEVERTIQNSGVNLDGRVYWADVLSPWLGYREKGNPNRSPLFRFKTDDRDVSRIFFFDPRQKRWFAIPSTYTSATEASRSEYRGARKELQKQGKERPAQHEVYDSVLRQRIIVERALAATEKAKKRPKKKKDQLKKDQQHRHTKREKQADSSTSSTSRDENIFELPSIDELPALDGTY